MIQDPNILLTNNYQLNNKLITLFLLPGVSLTFFILMNIYNFDLKKNYYEISKFIS